MGTEPPRLGILGGSGISEMEALEIDRTEEAGTPFGEPSGPLSFGTLDGVPVTFLPRHGEYHQLLPSEVPSRANFYALKQAGVNRVLGISAVGSLRQSIEPGTLIWPDQLIDYTRTRPSTFFGDDLVGHVEFGEPFCPAMASTVSDGGDAIEHTEGTYVSIEGPQFSTRAESERYRDENGDVIGMTVGPEAKLAREAEICYSLIGMVTDYDAWKGDEATADPQQIMETIRQTQQRASDTAASIVPDLYEEDRGCPCSSAQEGALITPASAVPESTREKLEPLIRNPEYQPDAS